MYLPAVQVSLGEHISETTQVEVSVTCRAVCWYLVVLVVLGQRLLPELLLDLGQSVSGECGVIGPQ